MKMITNILNFVSRLARLKENDPEIYEKLVLHTTVLGAIGGSFGTLWILALGYLLLQ